MDRHLVGRDEVVRPSSLSTCRHDCGRDCRSAVLRGDHHCDVVLWSRWSELGGAARDVVDVVAVEARRSQDVVEDIDELWTFYILVVEALYPFDVACSLACNVCLAPRHA